MALALDKSFNEKLKPTKQNNSQNKQENKSNPTNRYTHH
jgi:hypothetical protein